MKIIYINGKFLCQKITGVQRFAIEIVKQLDEIVDEKTKIYIIAPSEKYVVNKLALNNVEIIYLKGKPNYYWEQIKLARFCKKRKPYDLLNMCNLSPILYPGSCVIHDIAWIDAPNGYSKKFRLVYNFIIKRNIKKFRHIFTVSNVMKERIEEYFGVKNVQVIYNSAEHMLEIEPQMPNCDLPKEYYFSLGSMNPNKNFKAILKLATHNPNDYFIISGNNHKSFADVDYTNINNVIFTGYLNDNELIYLYKNCKAFLFPSTYEGFGIPPLEAMICKCNYVICNDIPVLRELYGDYAIFADFDNIDNLSINSLLCHKKSYNSITEIFNWKKSAKKLYGIICM